MFYSLPLLFIGGMLESMIGIIAWFLIFILSGIWSIVTILIFKEDIAYPDIFFGWSFSVVGCLGALVW